MSLPLPTGKTIKHSEEQLAAAKDLLADGNTPAETARLIAEQFHVSVRTGERVVKAVSPDMSDTVSESDTVRTDYLSSVLETMHRAMLASQASGDDETAFERAERLAGVLSRNKVRFSIDRN